MTNRDKLNLLSNAKFTLFIYRKLIPLGLRYIQTEKGIEQWLSEQADETFWENVQKEFSDITDRN